MRKLVVSAYMTLDGRVDDVRDWALPYADPEIIEYRAGLLENCDGLVLGRKTDEIFATTWPWLPGNLAYVEKMNRMAKYVASTTLGFVASYTLGKLAWENSHLIEADIADHVAALKREPGDTSWCMEVTT